MSHRVYTENEAEIHGRRRVCYTEGHKLRVQLDEGMRGCTQGGHPGSGTLPAACDEIDCERCDVTFTATYPPIGREVKP